MRVASPLRNILLQIDDLFLPSNIWDPVAQNNVNPKLIYRITANDLAQLAT